jgi:hypothetical protein
MIMMPAESESESQSRVAVQVPLSPSQSRPGESTRSSFRLRRRVRVSGSVRAWSQHDAAGGTQAGRHHDDTVTTPRLQSASRHGARPGVFHPLPDDADAFLFSRAWTLRIRVGREGPADIRTMVFTSKRNSESWPDLIIREKADFQIKH